MLNLTDSIEIEKLEHLREQVKCALSFYESRLRRLGFNHVNATTDQFNLIDRVGSPELLNRILRKLNPALEILDEVGNEYDWDISKFEDLKYIKIFCNRMGIKFRGDLYDHLEDGDVIEIYDNNGVQGFRNLNFFNICSYSLDVLFTLEWPELYKRDEGITKELVDTMTSALFGEELGIIQTDVPDHEVEELHSEGRSWCKIRQKIVCPLASSTTGGIVAALGSFRVLDQQFKGWTSAELGRAMLVHT